MLAVSTPPVSTPVHPRQLPSTLSTTMSSPVYASAASEPIAHRPATISELAARAQDQLWDPSKGLKHWLRTAEKARRNGDYYADHHDFERAFVEYARAATIVLEKLPTHRDYNAMLNADQRQNLGMVSVRSLSSTCILFPRPYLFVAIRGPVHSSSGVGHGRSDQRPLCDCPWQLIIYPVNAPSYSRFRATRRLNAGIVNLPGLVDPSWLTGCVMLRAERLSLCPATSNVSVLVLMPVDRMGKTSSKV